MDYTRCTCGEDTSEIEGDIKLCFDMSGLKIMYYADSVLKWNIKLKAEDTETYNYSSNKPEITTSVKPGIWIKLISDVKRGDRWFTLQLDETR